MSTQLRMIFRRLAARATATGTVQDGVVTAFTVVMVLGLFMLAGLVFDGGRALDGRVTALDPEATRRVAGPEADACNSATASGT